MHHAARACRSPQLACGDASELPTGARSGGSPGARVSTSASRGMLQHSLNSLAIMLLWHAHVSLAKPGVLQRCDDTCCITVLLCTLPPAAPPADLLPMAVNQHDA